MNTIQQITEDSLLAIVEPGEVGILVNQNK